jgi:hypothetical protein
VNGCAPYLLPTATLRVGGVGGINMLPCFVGALTIRDMKTARQQKEANTVEGNKVQLETQLWRAARSQCDNPWSRPSCAIMSIGLGISGAFGSGQVPV